MFFTNISNSIEKKGESKQRLATDTHKPHFNIFSSKPVHTLALRDTKKEEGERQKRKKGKEKYSFAYNSLLLVVILMTRLAGCLLLQ